MIRYALVLALLAAQLLHALAHGEASCAGPLLPQAAELLNWLRNLLPGVKR